TPLLGLFLRDERIVHQVDYVTVERLSLSVGEVAVLRVVPPLPPCRVRRDRRRDQDADQHGACELKNTLGHFHDSISSMGSVLRSSHGLTKGAGSDAVLSTVTNCAQGGFPEQDGVPQYRSKAHVGFRGLTHPVKDLST